MQRRWRPMRSRRILFKMSISQVMKHILTILLFLPAIALADPWTTGEKVAEGTYLTLHVVDLMQIRYIAKHPSRYYESFNSILGPHPSIGRVNMWFLGTAIAQPIIASLLPSEWRRAWLAAGIGMEFALTTHNAAVGIKMNY